MSVDVSKLKIGVVTALFNRPVTEKLEQGAIDYLRSKDLSENQILSVNVPGALEVPLAAQALLDAGCDGVVGLGAVIRGETTHYDYVCMGSERGCSQLQLEYKKPVAFGVITVENADQAWARAGGDKGNKGQEAAEVVMEMIAVIDKIKNPTPN